MNVNMKHQMILLLQKKSGDGAVKALGGSGEMKLSELLEGDPEFDSSLESAKEFLKKQGLECLVK